MPKAWSVAVATLLLASSAPAAGFDVPQPTGQSDVTLSILVEAEEAYVTNNSSTPLPLAGWAVMSVPGGQKFIFPEITVQPGGTVAVTSGERTHHQPPHFWRWTTEPVWSVPGVAGELLDPSGQLVALSIEVATSPAISDVTAVELTSAGVTSPSGVSLVVDASEELATIANERSTAVSLAGWTLLSVVGNQSFTFPDVTLQPGGRVDITSGPNASHVPPYTWRWSTANIWNNTGDPGELRDASGLLVATSNTSAPPTSTRPSIAGDPPPRAAMSASTAPASGISLAVDLRAERAFITNESATPVSLGGWTLLSLVGGQSFTIPDITLQAGARLEVTSGPTARNMPPYAIPWSTANIWNNDGDPGELHDANGRLVATSSNVSAPPAARQAVQPQTQPPVRRSTTRCGAVCKDGSRSNATGRGACSHHGGVARWVMCEAPTALTAWPESSVVLPSVDSTGWAAAMSCVAGSH